MKQTTKERALIEGRALLQQHGYHGFSFQDIADKLAIKKPSLYDHYSSKEDLILAILEDYSARFDSWTLTLKDLSPLERVRRAFDVFHAFASNKSKVCPILALAADFQATARSIQRSMTLFVDRWLTWLEQQIRQAQQSGHVRQDMDANTIASLVYSLAMGSQFQARIKRDPSLTLSAGDQIIALLANPHPSPELQRGATA